MDGKLIDGYMAECYEQKSNMIMTAKSLGKRLFAENRGSSIPV